MNNRKPHRIPRAIWIPWFAIALTWFVASIVVHGPWFGWEHPDGMVAYALFIGWTICARWMR